MISCQSIPLFTQFILIEIYCVLILFIYLGFGFYTDTQETVYSLQNSQWTGKPWYNYPQNSIRTVYYD